MEIGGLDTDCSWNGSIERLRLMLMAIRLWWPDSIIDRGGRDELGPPLVLECELFIYKNQFVRQSIEDLGVVTNLEPYFIHILVRPDFITFVTGLEKSEGWYLAQDLILTLHANKLE